MNPTGIKPKPLPYHGPQRVPTWEKEPAWYPHGHMPLCYAHRFHAILLTISMVIYSYRIFICILTVHSPVIQCTNSNSIFEINLTLLYYEILEKLGTFIYPPTSSLLSQNFNYLDLVSETLLVNLAASL